MTNAEGYLLLSSYIDAENIKIDEKNKRYIVILKNADILIFHFSEVKSFLKSFDEDLGSLIKQNKIQWQ